MKREKMAQVARLAKFEELQSARELNAVQTSHEQKRAQLDQLMQFKRDYEETLGKVGGEGMAAKQLQDYRLFLSKLNEAIAAQESEVQSDQESLALVRSQWLTKSQRTEALDHLVDEQVRTQLQAREKAAQRESDENALARRFLD